MVLGACAESDHAMPGIARILGDEAIEILLVRLTVGVPVDEDDRRLHPDPLVEEVRQRTTIEDRPLSGCREAPTLPIEEIEECTLSAGGTTVPQCSGMVRASDRTPVRAAVFSREHRRRCLHVLQLLRIGRHTLRDPNERAEQS